MQNENNIRNSIMISRNKYFYYFFLMVYLVNHEVVAQETTDSLEVYDLQDTIVVVQPEYQAPRRHFIAGFDYRF